jgi:two-component system, OmpR family, catabolic regulation response regulator CreB
MNISILIVEDEPSIADTLQYALEKEQYQVFHALNAQQALDLCSLKNIDLALLDVGLPDLDGFSLARKLMQNHNFPILFLTARNDEIDRIVGLELGADDYILKPFSPREVVARVRAVLRRCQKQQEFTVEQPAHLMQIAQESLPFLNFIIDEDAFEIKLKSEKLDFSKIEFNIVLQLFKNPSRVYSRDQLMAFIWDDPLKSTERTIDTHIKNIRAKFAKVDPLFDPIKTIRGIGYSWQMNL